MAALAPSDLLEAYEELSIAKRKKRLPRGLKAARRSSLVSKTVVATLQAFGHNKWAHRVSQCSETFSTTGCPNGHGGTVHATMTKRCGLSCCPVCTRLQARRLSRALVNEMPAIALKSGAGQRYIWRFLTLSLRPRATFKQSWEDAVEVRTKLFQWLKRLHGGVHPDAICAIEFGLNGHPHLHVLYFGKFIVRDELSRRLVEWTGGTVVDLDPQDWVPQGKPTKRGKQRYRSWTAQGGDWYVDVREVKGSLYKAIAEISKYVADPFGGGGDVLVAADAAKVVGASRNAAAIAVAGEGRHRIQGYGLLKGIVGRALGKKGRTKAAQGADEGRVSCVRFCPHCGEHLVSVPRVDRDAYAWFNRANPVLLQPPPAPS